MSEYAYTFPATKWVEGNDNITDQACHIEEEASEVDNAIWDYCFEGGSLEDIAIETVDAIQACETMLRILEYHYDVDIDAAVKDVYIKNAARGYYS